MVEAIWEAFAIRDAGDLLYWVVVGAFGALVGWYVYGEDDDE